MKNEKKYEEHIKESWEFATKTAGSTNAEMKSKLALLIFEKTCSPHHYFIQNESQDPDKPTSKQLKYAKQLGIKNPAGYTKQALSNEIERVKHGT